MLNKDDLPVDTERESVPEIPHARDHHRRDMSCIELTSQHRTSIHTLCHPGHTDPIGDLYLKCPTVDSLPVGSERSN